MKKATTKSEEKKEQTYGTLWKPAPKIPIEEMRRNMRRAMSRLPRR